MKEQAKQEEKVLAALDAVHALTANEPYAGSFYNIICPEYVGKNLAACVFQYLTNHSILIWNGNKRLPEYQWAREKTAPNPDLAKNIVMHFNADTYKSSVITRQQKQEEIEKKSHEEKETAYAKGVADTLSKLIEAQDFFRPLGFNIEISKIK
ncbi:hypothetical protein LJC53_02070 [Bacteroidales bacterium OttesenSCG-928-C03]|nr:hypothetical protein [Bacteroidales bacterium OttesenSCG-928-C03]